MQELFLNKEHNIRALLVIPFLNKKLSAWVEHTFVTYSDTASHVIRLNVGGKHKLSQTFTTVETSEFGLTSV